MNALSLEKISPSRLPTSGAINAGSELRPPRKSQFIDKNCTTQSNARTLTDQEVIDYLDKDVTRVECPSCHHRGHLAHDCILCAGIGVVPLDRLCPESLADDFTEGESSGAKAWMYPGLYCIEHLGLMRWWIVTEDRCVVSVSNDRINRLWVANKPLRSKARAWLAACYWWLLGLSLQDQ